MVTRTPARPRGRDDADLRGLGGVRAAVAGALRARLTRPADLQVRDHAWQLLESATSRETDADSPEAAGSGGPA